MTVTRAVTPFYFSKEVLGAASGIPLVDAPNGLSGNLESTLGVLKG
jgi:hypothetical protein